MMEGRCLFLIAVFGASAGGIPARATEASPLGEALSVLGETPAGAAILGESMRFWKVARVDGLLEHIKASEVSRTDSVLVRRYDPSRGSEVRERQVSVYIRFGQPLESTVLDLAHELVHATAAPAWDPYDPGLTAGRYVKISIEGPGGEIEAVKSECEVGRENRKLLEEAKPRCEAYWSPLQAGVDAGRVRDDFYRVGQWMGWVERQLGAERAGFSSLSAKAPRLYSSTGRAPYPVSLIQEYREITAIACDNSRRRVEQAGRGPASAASPEARELIRRRCQAEPAPPAAMSTASRALPTP